MRRVDLIDELLMSVYSLCSSLDISDFDSDMSWLVGWNDPFYYAKKQQLVA